MLVKPFKLTQTSSWLSLSHSRSLLLSLKLQHEFIIDKGLIEQHGLISKLPLLPPVVNDTIDTAMSDQQSSLFAAPMDPRHSDGSSVTLVPSTPSSLLDAFVRPVLSSSLDTGCTQIKVNQNMLHGHLAFMVGILLLWNSTFKFIRMNFVFDVG